MKALIGLQLFFCFGNWSVGGGKGCLKGAAVGGAAGHFA